jgi:hypothetical protein
MVHAALGLRAHSGWAALVAITGPPHAPDVVLRQRIDFLDRSIPGAAQPYHAAAEMEIGKGAELIGKCIAASRLLAARALKNVIAELRKKTCEPIACGILTASGRALPDLPAILASHPLVHTAEGVMFREVLSYAAERNGLAMVHVPEKELFDAAKDRLGIAEGALKRHLAELGRRIGPPWRQDEKNATVSAALALAAATR